jgi:hypothetical protein
MDENEAQIDPHAAMNLHAFEHEPAPPDPRRLLPAPAMAARGAGLGAVAIGLVFAATTVTRKFGWFGSPVALLSAVGALLSAWGALIHLTGGEKFDDHRWI